MNRREKGAHYEEKAAEYLTERGYEVIKRNYRCRVGEIDLICRDGRYLVFVEVKYRVTMAQGGAFAAVDARKQHRITRVARYYFMEQGLSEDTPCRFDVVAVDGEKISLIQNAFDAC